MLFKIGELYLEPDESLYVGDPCYIPDSLGLMVKYDQPWVKDHDILSEEWAKPTTINDKIHKDKWVKHGALKYRYISVYVDMRADSFFGGNPRAASFILWNDLDTVPKLSKCKIRSIGVASVDSGQVSFIAGSTLATWTKINEDGSRGSYVNPLNDMDACSQTTLESQLSAGANERHVKFKSHGSQSQQPVATVFSSSTFYGDGTYDVYELIKIIKDQDVPMGLLVDFTGKYSKDY